MAGKKALQRANAQKKDEFYTQLPDIEEELRRYKDAFKGKVVLCNCDDPYESNFFKYFALNFTHLGLKKLIATSFSGSPIAYQQLDLFKRERTSEGESEITSPKAYKVEITHIPDSNNSGSQDLADIEDLLTSNENVCTLLEGNGDFRSPECVAALEEADIVVSNPPFSLFREYIDQLITHKKKFLVLGNQNAITYKEIYPLIKSNEIWLGYNNGGTKWFRVPSDYTHTSTEGRVKVEDGVRYHSMGNVYWFTNLDTTRRHEELTLVRKYSPEEYPQYDNDEAIEVSRYKEIPEDYPGTMGVPITFLQHYNPDQFEIIKFRKGSDGKDLTINGKSKYFRIIIRNKHLQESLNEN